MAATADGALRAFHSLTRTNSASASRRLPTISRPSSPSSRWPTEPRPSCEPATAASASPNPATSTSAATPSAAELTVMCSDTAMRGRRSGATANNSYHQRAFPQLNAGVVGLAGLEPAPSSLSGIEGWAPCYPAFSQLVLIHEWHRDGVNHTHPHQLTIAVYLRALARGAGCS